MLVCYEVCELKCASYISLYLCISDFLPMCHKILVYLFIIYFMFLLLFKYSCLHFPATTFPCPTLNPSPLWHCPWVLNTCCLMTLLLLSLIIPFPPPLWLLSVYSLFQCLWLYFVCLFVLLLRLHL